MKDDDDLRERPRIGSILKADGTEITVLFVPADHEGRVFKPVLPDGSDVYDLVGAGDQLQVDVIAPGQAVVLPFPP